MSQKKQRILTHLLTLFGVLLVLAGGIMWGLQYRAQAALAQQGRVVLALNASGQPPTWPDAQKPAPLKPTYRLSHSPTASASPTTPPPPPTTTTYSQPTQSVPPTQVELAPRLLVQEPPRLLEQATIVFKMQPRVVEQATLLVQEAPTSERSQSVPPTSEPTATVPPTSEPTQSVPPTTERSQSVPPTSERTQSVPPTSEPTATVPPTSQRTQSVPPTSERTQSVPPTSEPIATVPSTSEPTATMPPTSEPTATVPPTSEPTATVPPTPQPFLPAQVMPSRILAPAINLDSSVVEMGWQVKSDGNGNQYSEWVVPEFAAGWHKNSLLPGHGGNTVLSAHNNSAGEVFRDLADIEPGHTIQLEADGISYSYVVEEKYIVKEEGQPIEVRRENNRFIEPTADERLTLVSCWPYQTNSHRVIVIARPVLEGVQ